MPKSTATAARFKPEKPVRTRAPFPHVHSRRAKKIKLRFIYSDEWDTPTASVDLYIRQRDDHYIGRKPETANRTD